MARPKTSNDKRITTAVRIPQPLHERLTSEADTRDISVNLLIVKAVENYLDNLVPMEQVTATR